MSILIKNMKTPENCDKCPFGEWTDALYFHCFSMDYEYQMKHGEKLEGCPLITVSTPHGRLIDADRLSIQRENYDTYNDYSEAFDMIDNAPTVIESEK